MPVIFFAGPKYGIFVQLGARQINSFVDNWSELKAARYTWCMRATIPALGPLLLIATACVESPTGPDLVTVTGLSPQIVEIGDTLQVSGHGFPEGVPARLSFHGDLFRAGQVPKRNVDIVVRTQDTSKDTVTLSVNDELEQAFCGVGDVAAHATFRGNISIAFSSRASGLAPVSGTLRDVDIEVEPKLKSNQVEQERLHVSNEAQRFLGLTLGDSSPSDCCTVTAAQGRALLAGIKPGDRLLDFDGVSVLRPADLVPSGRNRSARLTVRRQESNTVLVRNIDVQGFRWTIPSELAPAFACVLTALGILLAAISPLGASMRSLASAIARGLDNQLQAKKLRQLGHWWSILKQCTADSPLPETASVKIAAVGSVVALGSLSAVIAIREELLSAELDLPLWWLITTIAITLTAFLLSLAHARIGVVRSFAFAVQAILHQIPLLALIASIVVVTRTSRLVDIVHAQGGWPQDWLLVHDPALTVTAIVAMIALIPTVAPPKTMVTAKLESACAKRRQAMSPSTALITFVANRLHVWVQALLLSILLLGGWSVPGIESGEANNLVAAKLFAIAVLLAKTWAIIALVSIVRWSIGSLSLRHTARWLLRRGLPVAFAASLLTFTWAYCVRYWAILWADAVVHWVVLGLLLAATGLFIRVTVKRILRDFPLSPVNPWI